MAPSFAPGEAAFIDQNAAIQTALTWPDKQKHSSEMKRAYVWRQLHRLTTRLQRMGQECFSPEHSVCLWRGSMQHPPV